MSQSHSVTHCFGDASAENEKTECIHSKLISYLKTAEFKEICLLTPTFRDALLEDKFPTTLSKDFHYTHGEHDYSIGLGRNCNSSLYPVEPFFCYFVSSLLHKILTANKDNSVNSVKLNHGYGKVKQEDCINLEKIQDVYRSYISDSFFPCQCSIEASLVALIKKFLTEISDRNVLDIMGFGNTMGSADLFPPSIDALISSFNRRHDIKSNLTVGARALAKHCHRASDLWWGPFTGTEASKNDYANKALIKLMSDVSWINIHCLPHDVKIIELRCSLGYGARWLSDGSEFRGFLEPQIEDGHDVKWKH